MTPQVYIKTYYTFAKQVEKEFGIPVVFSLGQSALETGWGKTIVGNMMFGVKDTDGVNGNEQLLTTTEYHNTPHVKYPVIFTIIELVKGKRWKYKVKDWFRKYPTPYESFRDHAIFLQSNKRYREALTYKYMPFQFAKSVCDAGYATAPDYWTNLESVMKRVQSLIK
jgi:flagellum-specific peptidoglycan hydrolase FlgJ